MQNLIGFVLLALSLLLAASLFWYYKNLNSERIQAESVVADVESQVNQSQKPMMRNSDSATTKEVMAFSNKVIQKLNLPWDDFFVLLEKAKSENIALLGLEPNAKDAKVKLTGEAKNFKAMFDYVRALRAQPVLQNVYLIEHKIDEENPDKPVRFTLEAAWIAKH